MCSCGRSALISYSRLKRSSDDLVLRDVLVEHLQRRRASRSACRCPRRRGPCRRRPRRGGSRSGRRGARRCARRPRRGPPGPCSPRSGRSRRPGRTRRRSGTMRWQTGQLFIARGALRTPATSLSRVPTPAEVRGCRARPCQPAPGRTSVQLATRLSSRGASAQRRSREVDDAVARRALLEDGLAAQAVEQLRRQGHVAGLAGAVGRLRDGRAALGADHVVAAVELRRQRLGGRVALGLLRLRPCPSTSPSFELMSPSRGPSSSASFLCSASVASICWRRRVGVGRELADLLLAVADQLAELLELALGGVRLALGPRARQLLARVLELLVHVANVLDQLAAGLVHGGEGRAVGGELLVELGDAGLQSVERRALLRQLRPVSSFSSASICASFSRARIWSGMLNA